MLRAFEQYWPQ